MATALPCKFVLASGYEMPAVGQLNPSDIKILWWNLQKGETNQRIFSKQGQRPLDENICALMNSPFAPDVFVFGEYADSVLQPETMKELKAKFPFYPSTFYSTNPEWSERGIMVFSRYPFEETKVELIDYYPPDEKDAAAISKYKERWSAGFPDEKSWPRFYHVLKVKTENQELSLSPVHLLQPWEKMFQEMGGGRFAKIWVKLKVTFGSDNPLIYQVQWLRRKLERDFGRSLNKDRLMVIGDFNLPPKVWSISTRLYKTMAKDFLDPFANSGATSWPAEGSKEVEGPVGDQYRLDYAFLSRGTATGMSNVFQLLGSDHYPLFVTVRGPSEVR